MAPYTLLLFALFWAPHILGQKNKKPDNPIEKISIQPNFDYSQFSGKWYLKAVASECNYLKEHNHEVVATSIQASVTRDPRNPKAAERLSISTFRTLDGICWEIRQLYLHNKAKGKFLLQAQGSKGQLDVVVGETDYQNFAILYYQHQRKLTIKLYARTVDVSDNIVQKYEAHVSKFGIDMEFIYYFPTYGFCDRANEFNILNNLPN